MKKNHVLPSLILLSLTVPAFAQMAPDAGRTSQELMEPRSMPDRDTAITVETPATTSVAPGGSRVALTSILFSGNELFSSDELLSVLGPVEEQSFDLAGIKGLAAKISNFYHKEGYPFAKVYVPEQKLEKGVLRLQVIEGRYGQVKATSEDAETAVRAQDFLGSLRQGGVIEASQLERSTLILGDQPGVKASPIVRPGKEFGTGDLDIPVTLESGIHGAVGADNFGNRYTGEYRARLNLFYDSPFLFGDRIALKSLVSTEGTWLGMLGYSLPVGPSGLRAEASFSQTQYYLGQQFDSLDATGYAKTLAGTLSYPILRSKSANLYVEGSYQHKDLFDERGATSTEDTKYSDSLPITAQFDWRDTFLGDHAVTYGAFSWTHGWLNLGQSLRATDTATARTNGPFDKFNLDIARLQRLPENFSLFGRISRQWAVNNLDSSESFGLGGPNGVRAYPVGEAYGDAGWLAQVELRYDIDSFTPYTFYDAGLSRVNIDTWDNSKNYRRIGGPGLGVRFEQDGLKLDASVAWRTPGGRPQSDSQDRVPRLWLTAEYSF